MEISQLYQVYLQYPVICTDTRQITKDCIFFALKGENFNGNSFAEKALKAGAAYAVIDEAEYHKGSQYILVNDVLKTLQQLANHHRRQLDIPFIGITGTNGKTTTKELIHSVLSQKFKSIATRGNLNNHIGVPLTLLSINRETEIAVIEMGANHQKEIGFLCTIAEPTHGLITNVGKAHLEGFGGFEGVKKGKGELYDFLKGTGRPAFINHDNELLMQMCNDRNLQNTIFYGTTDACFVKGSLLANDPFLKIKWTANGQSHEVASNLTGIYNFENILSAIAVGLHFGLKAEEINRGISAYRPVNNRSQVTQTDKNLLICDYYNANPSSMEVALDNFAAFQAEHKAFILGDMFELGEDSEQEHRFILNKALSLKAGLKIFAGKEFFKLKTAGALFFETTDEVFEFLEKEAIKNSVILIKGSRGMKLEKLVELL